MSSKKLPPFPGIPLPTPSSSTAAAAAAAAAAGGGGPSSSSPLSNRANISLPAPTLPFSTYPQPHFHRAWYRKCLHSTPTVRIPYGPEVEYLSTTTEGGGGGGGGGSVGGRYITTNKNRLCMCDSVDGYFLEEVGQSAAGGSSLYVEKEVVEEFWRILEWEDEKEGKLRKEKEGKVVKVVKVVKGVMKGVKEVVGSVSVSVSPGKRRKEKERKRVLRWVPRWRRLEGCCAGCAGVGEEGEEGGLRWRVV
ncbi:hypothetical protein TWF102_002088 [Orbilia oligospora]|uniref:Uncharacterized protein n=1 Tax=Orbilia oligospora TaxID=2813651 RepID=A0A7C8N3U7_ORBOL|nr:hypothetical protein TWF102_002088 [Orbilia oligospora]KAF3083575.1 hypothetical protein TWF103_002894 [Orbilia oligospora]